MPIPSRKIDDAKLGTLRELEVLVADPGTALKIADQDQLTPWQLRLHQDLSSHSQGGLKTGAVRTQFHLIQPRTEYRRLRTGFAKGFGVPRESYQRGAILWFHPGKRISSGRARRFPAILERHREGLIDENDDLTPLSSGSHASSSSGPPGPSEGGHQCNDCQCSKGKEQPVADPPSSPRRKLHAFEKHQRKETPEHAIDGGAEGE